MSVLARVSVLIVVLAVTGGMVLGWALAVAFQSTAAQEPLPPAAAGGAPVALPPLLPAGGAGCVPTVPALALSPNHFKDVLLVVNFNWQNYLTQYHNLIALFDQLYVPHFYDVKYMGDLGPCPHCRKNPELVLNREHLREYNTSAGYSILEGLAYYVQEYKGRVRGVLYINDDILLDMQKIVTLDKSRIWIAEVSRNCTYENQPTVPGCPWGRWSRVREAYLATLQSLPPLLRQRIDANVGRDRYLMSYSDMVYLPSTTFDDFVTFAPYFWRQIVMSELAVITIAVATGCEIAFLPYTNIADFGRRGVRSFFDLIYQPDSKAYFGHGLKFTHVTPLNEIHMFRKLYGQLVDAVIGPRRTLNLPRANGTNPANYYTRVLPGDGFEIPP